MPPWAPLVQTTVCVLPWSVYEATGHATPASTTETSEALRAPKPLPVRVTAVPPRAEPSVGWTDRSCGVEAAE